MNDNFKVLLNQFKNIARKKWIQSISHGHGTVGLTFEHELGKKIDCDYKPDYKKTKYK